ncbi:MAG: valine--tRNA ligase, partial [Spirochaetota bacterium]|nr:valine--tRNA ligase [Spirochaetota bacterium]
MDEVNLSKTYNPKEFEDKWYKIWLDRGYFHAEIDREKLPYTIVIPPPNVTSQLHMGHGLNNTIQDILIRWKRMCGQNTLWMPGTDHAGIATQNVVEKKLAKENKTRHHYERSDFVNEVWKWKEQYGSIIIEQLKKMGCSCDWVRERFTMDEGLSHAVREVFVRFYEDGLIYKGKYIVNWCPRCGTALSQEEVEHEELNGFLYHIKYSVKGENRFIEVATTRPETMLGDTAVAVNPKDKRYKDLIGKSLILPLVNREIPVVGDEYTDMEFGTGAVKVTPAHDPNDFLIGRRHNLEQINVMNPDGTMNKDAGTRYEGLDRFECRKKVIEDLTNEGLFINKESHIHSVGHCYRCHTVVEPYLSDQWFVKMKPLAEKATKVVLEDKVVFYPDKWKKVYLHWMDNIQDWCISRQIWWGHRIPVWVCKDCNETLVSRTDLTSCTKCNSDNIEQDHDVLDTWFSSMLWPFSTLGWPNKNEDLNYFYPTNVLSTAPEILFFWVARMIMAGLYFIGDIPFREVYLHSTVRDKLGRKMSKSLGNGIDPLEVIDKHGADAMRFTIISLAPIGLDIKLAFDDKQNDFLAGTRFANKIWNASRFILLNLNEDQITNIKNIKLDLSDKWILSQLQDTIKSANNDFNTFRFNDVAMTLYNFIWHDFCDWYVELSKINLYGNSAEKKKTSSSILVYVLSESLKLLHPIM